MKDMDEALSWLTWESGSKLTSNTRFWIDRFTIPTLDTLEREEIVQALERLVRGVVDPLEQAEIFTFLGVYHYFLFHYSEAEASLINANKLFEFLDDLHKRAVTSWMLYLIHRAQGKFHQSFNDGRRARQYFANRGVQYRQLEDQTTESWYLARVHDLTTYLIQTPEDMYEWLFEFQGSRLKATASQLRDHIQEQVESRVYTSVKDEMDVLLEITRLSLDCEETAEAHAYCGVVEWLMKLPNMNPLFYFRSALALYIPASHEYAILTWMLGLVQLTYTQIHVRAKGIVTLESAIDQFDRLREHALMENDIPRRDWYALHHVAMRRELRTRTIV